LRPRIARQHCTNTDSSSFRPRWRSGKISTVRSRNPCDNYIRDRLENPRVPGAELTGPLQIETKILQGYCSVATSIELWKQGYSLIKDRRGGYAGRAGPRGESTRELRHLSINWGTSASNVIGALISNNRLTGWKGCWMVKRWTPAVTETYCYILWYAFC
jgi:hypothetical protein